MAMQLANLALEVYADTHVRLQVCDRHHLLTNNRRTSAMTSREARAHLAAHGAAATHARVVSNSSVPRDNSGRKVCSELLLKPV